MRKARGAALQQIADTARELVAPAAPAPIVAMHLVLLDAVLPSSTNPRKHFDQAKLDGLAESIRQKGVLEPILVRTTPEGRNVELVAGERRVRAARAAGLKEIPAVVRDLTDQEVLEIQVVENIQRDDLTPLEEAEGYARLAKTGYDVAHIAEKIGRSVKYVYDRMKLTDLVKEAKELLDAGTITAGHAILLARLKPEDQERVIEIDSEGYREPGGIWQRQRGLFLTDEEEDGPGEEDPLKPVSVRELTAWIDRNVKLEAPDVDQMILPETAATLAAAAEESVKVLRITYDVMTPEPLRDGPKVILGRSWERADGLHGSKTCDHSRLAMLVIGQDRGQTLQACVAKDKCLVHWKARVQAKKKAAAAAGKAVAKGEDPVIARRRAEEAEQKKREEEDRRWKTARPALIDALVLALGKAPAGAAGDLGKMILDVVSRHNRHERQREAAKHVPPGKTAEALVRHLGAVLLLDQIDDRWDRDAFIKQVKVFGVDVKKILDTAAPKVQTSATKAKGSAARARA